MLTGHSIQLGCIAADPIIRSDLDFLVFLDQSEHWSPPLVGEPKLPLEGRQGTWFNHLVSYLDLALSHCAPCNTFGEQREIYEWIGLFRGALFFLQGGAFFYSGRHFLGFEKSTAKFRGA